MRRAVPLKSWGVVAGAERHALAANNIITSPISILILILVLSFRGCCWGHARIFPPLWCASIFTSPFRFPRSINFISAVTLRIPHTLANVIRFSILVSTQNRIPLKVGSSVVLMIYFRRSVACICQPTTPFFRHATRGQRSRCRYIDDIILPVPNCPPLAPAILVTDAEALAPEQLFNTIALAAYRRPSARCLNTEHYYNTVLMLYLARKDFQCVLFSHSETRALHWAVELLEKMARFRDDELRVIFLRLKIFEMRDVWSQQSYSPVVRVGDIDELSDFTGRNIRKDIDWAFHCDASSALSYSNLRQSMLITDIAFSFIYS